MPLIIFEGPDRCGKTTQAKRLVESLHSKGIPSELWRFPDRSTPIGTLIDTYLQSKIEMDDRTIHLLFSANRWEKQKEMESKLADGITLVVDRYVYSGAAFTSAKGIDLDWCKAPDEGLPVPDKVIYLEMDGYRDGFGDERYETVEFQHRVKKKFDTMREEWWTIVDASGTVDEVHERIWNEVLYFGPTRN